MGDKIQNVNTAMHQLRTALLQCNHFERMIHNQRRSMNATIVGSVQVESTPNDVFVLHESGKWQTKNIKSSDCYRLCLLENHVSIERKRQGQFVHLCNLKLKFECYFQSDSDYRCGSDIYRAHLYLHPHALTLIWCIKGPKKKCVITTNYDLMPVASNRAGS